MLDAGEFVHWRAHSMARGAELHWASCLSNIADHVSKDDGGDDDGGGGDGGGSGKKWHVAKTSCPFRKIHHKVSGS